MENIQNVEPEDRIDFIDTGTVAQQDEHTLNQEAPGSAITQRHLLDDYNTPESWLQYNGNLLQSGDTPVSRLTPNNVATLSQAYVIETDSAGLQNNPVIVPGDPPVMYITQGNQVVRAVNARTGDEYWEFRYSTRREGASAGTRNRGVALYGDNVYFAAHDLHMVALDRYTGELQWTQDFMMEEQIDEMPNAVQRVSNTEAPLVYDGKLFIGASGDAAGWTHLTVMDTSDGEIINQHRVAPKSEWIGDSWQFSSGAAWMSPSVDPQTDTAFFATANPDPMLNGAVRPGPNKFTNAIIAVDTQSGDIKWTNQIHSHELWDYDVGHVTPYVFDAEIDGEEHRLVSVDNKTAWTYMIDVETGKLIDRTDAWGRQEHRFGSWPDSEFLNLPPWGQENAANMTPTFPGATEWPPDAFSRRTGYRYVGYVDAEDTVATDPSWEFGPENFDGFGGFWQPDAEFGNTAYFQAIDLESGEVQWRTEVADVNPDLTSSAAFLGGVTATTGGVVMAGSSGGSLIAYDDESGDQLWMDDTGGRITASPVVWDDPIAGEAYVAVSSNDRIIVYSGGAW